MANDNKISRTNLEGPSSTKGNLIDKGLHGAGALKPQAAKPNSQSTSTGGNATRSDD